MNAMPRKPLAAYRIGCHDLLVLNVIQKPERTYIYWMFNDVKSMRRSVLQTDRETGELFFRIGSGGSEKVYMNDLKKVKEEKEAIMAK